MLCLRKGIHRVFPKCNLDASAVYRERFFLCLLFIEKDLFILCLLGAHSHNVPACLHLLTLLQTTEGNDIALELPSIWAAENILETPEGPIRKPWSMDNIIEI